MTLIQDASWNCLLADATYAIKIDVNDVKDLGLSDLLRTRMTEPIASFIAANFSLVTHVDTDDYTGSGFDASVWRRKDGKLYVSMTGSEGVQDFS